MLVFLSLNSIGYMASAREVISEAAISPWLPDLVISSIRSELKNTPDSASLIKAYQCAVTEDGQTKPMSMPHHDDVLRVMHPQPRNLWRVKGQENRLSYEFQKRRQIALQDSIQKEEKNRLREKSFLNHVGLDYL